MVSPKFPENLAKMQQILYPDVEIQCDQGIQNDHGPMTFLAVLGIQWVEELGISLLSG